jgi:hypothetical protein
MTTNIPHAPPGGAELAARCTAAAAALADYRRDEASPDGVNWAMWAGRLAAALERMLTAAQPATLTKAQLATVLDALDVAADAKRDMAANSPDCEASTAELRGTCEWRLFRAEEYDALARTLRGNAGAGELMSR